MPEEQPTGHLNSDILSVTVKLKTGEQSTREVSLGGGKIDAMVSGLRLARDSETVHSDVSKDAARALHDLGIY